MPSPELITASLLTGGEATPADAGGASRSRWDMPTEERHAGFGGSWGQGTPAVDNAPGGPGAARHGASEGVAAGGEGPLRVTAATTPPGTNARGVAAISSTPIAAAPPLPAGASHTPAHEDGGASGDDGGAESCDYGEGGGWEDEDVAPNEAADSGATAADGASPAAAAARKRRAPPGERNQRLRKGLRKSLAGALPLPLPT